MECCTHASHDYVVDTYDKTKTYMFKYGVSCFTSLIDHGCIKEINNMQTILCIGCETGAYERIICKEMFGVDQPILSDIEPKHDVVEKLSCLEAIDKYPNVDALMFCFQSFLASGYDVSKFKGKYIIFIGELHETGHTNPDDLLDSIYECFNEYISVPLKCCCTYSYCYEQLCVFKRK
ncbi:hypothetical protein ECIV_ORF45 [European chub iridovirus]|nr:hypothetical protein ECIV_ORF45 [European chub iridovirus]